MPIAFHHLKFSTSPVILSSIHLLTQQAYVLVYIK